jgi:hypothetical protein
LTIKLKYPDHAIFYFLDYFKARRKRIAKHAQNGAYEEKEGITM